MKNQNDITYLESEEIRLIDILDGEYDGPDLSDDQLWAIHDELRAIRKQIRLLDTIEYYRNLSN